MRSPHFVDLFIKYTDCSTSEMGRQMFPRVVAVLGRPARIADLNLEGPNFITHDSRGCQSSSFEFQSYCRCSFKYQPCRYRGTTGCPSISSPHGPPEARACR